MFCDDDIIAAGLYLAARERRLRVPRDLSVIGFDDLEFARVLDPALTTLALDGVRWGTAFALLEPRMAGARPRRPSCCRSSSSSAAPPARRLADVSRARGRRRAARASREG